MKPLSLLTFFAAAKKVSAAPHRGNANKPLTNQGKAKDPDQQENRRPGKNLAHRPRQTKKNQAEGFL
ncbi:hypothetical protein [Paraburkholderia fungorum]|uniref:hypothetical protein n=1 Tax=Paraburkholderia fungorum TaxID=134537 RepID=UPI0015B39405|nr:hypothetical protein [Paraburkholderia fungorum]